MPMRYVQIVLSSEAPASALLAEIAQAFERVRQRAFTIYDSRAAEVSACEFDDWLQAEREIFDVPIVSLESDGELSRLFLPVEPSANRPLTILVEPSCLTILGHHSDGCGAALCLLSRINLSETIDPPRTRVLLKRGAGLQVIMTHHGVPAPEPAPLKAMAAMVG